MLMTWEGSIRSIRFTTGDGRIQRHNKMLAEVFEKAMERSREAQGIDHLIVDHHP